jgi:hypothetical protein
MICSYSHKFLQEYSEHRFLSNRVGCGFPWLILSTYVSSTSDLTKSFHGGSHRFIVRLAVMNECVHQPVQMKGFFSLLCKNNELSSQMMILDLESKTSQCHSAE